MISRAYLLVASGGDELDHALLACASTPPYASSVPTALRIELAHFAYRHTWTQYHIACIHTVRRQLSAPHARICTAIRQRSTAPPFRIHSVNRQLSTPYPHRHTPAQLHTRRMLRVEREAHAPTMLATGLATIVTGCSSGMSAEGRPTSDPAEASPTFDIAEARPRVRRVHKG